MTGASGAGSSAVCGKACWSCSTAPGGPSQPSIVPSASPVAAGFVHTYPMFAMLAFAARCHVNRASMS